MLKRFFDTSAIDSFAERLVAEMSRILPPGNIELEGKAATRLRERLEEILRRRVAAFNASTCLGVVQKARIGTRLQARMENAGYTAEFAHQLSYDIVRMVATGTAARRR